MNRIRKAGNVYQVLVTPSIKISPDSSLMVGNWDDAELRGYYILEFNTLNDALASSMSMPDIDWYRFVLNHKYIYQRLETELRRIISDTGFTVDFYPHLMDPEFFKNTMMDRVALGGPNFSMRMGMSDLITFIIINPWTDNLHKLSHAIENTRAHLYRDDLRIIGKQVINDKIIILTGKTEFGSTYSIKLIPTLIHHYNEWYRKTGFLKPEQADKLFQETLQKQNEMDRLVIR